MTEVLEGSCLCGAVTYKASTGPMMVGHCYCVDCRKASGTSHSTHAVVPDAAFALSGETRAFECPADSGNMVARHFCPLCGCAIYSRNSAMPGMTFIRASSLNKPSAITPEMTVYASRAPDWAVLDTGKPVFDIMPEGGPEAVLAES